MKFLAYTLGDPNAPMTPPSPEMMAEMGKFVEEATKAGVLLGHRRRRPAERGGTGPARTCATRRCGSGRCWPSWCGPSPRCTAWWH